MRRFEMGQRVRVVSAKAPWDALSGQRGTVVLLKSNNSIAWVAMDEPIPDSVPRNCRHATHPEWVPLLAEEVVPTGRLRGEAPARADREAA